MASNFQAYSLLFCSINSATLTEEAKLTLKRVNGAKLVETVLKGLAGVSPGAPMVSGTISNMVPAAGVEFDAGPYIIGNGVNSTTPGPIPVSMKVVRSDGKGLVFQAILMDDDLAHSVGAAAGYDIAFVGYFDPNSWS